ncbi:MAG: exopolyphosphatase [Oscillospiraceae bacterium]|jgi:nanoRNase/pAp phosphatase (c-di-AMP/oligoRNAs hydrolase)|nr:exopolyphosphatase [Oscillospiraceae bacterium]
MRLITRSDFDGLACAVFLKKAGIIDSYKFAHPKDIQDSLVEVTENDCLANVPYVKGCGLWFDHHTSEAERLPDNKDYAGRSHPAPSAAHIIYDYYGGAEKFPGFEEMLKGVDKVDSANLTIEEILNPTDWVLLGFVMDPRTGLGRFRNFTISNYQLMEKMIDWCSTLPIKEILELPDVKERLEVYFKQTELFIDMVNNYSRVYEEIVVTDLRGISTIYSGNRFLIYSLFPQCNLNIWIISGRGGMGCSCAIGHSIINKNSPVDVGKICLKYGGGGHFRVGTCQFPDENMNRKVKEVIKELRELNKVEITQN